MGLIVRRLERTDDRTQFRSGNLDLHRFFQRYAGQNQFRHHLGTTYIAVDDARIAGFVTVAPSQIDSKQLPAAGAERRAPYPLPVLRLARLAVDEREQGRGVGLALLRFVFVLAHRMADDYGCAGIVVDAKADAVAFYKRYGFVSFEVAEGLLGDRPRPTPMFLELGAIPRVDASVEELPE